MRVFGVILAGGQAQRMGGGDKCLLEIGGQPLLNGMIARLAPQVERCALNANGDSARFAPWGLPVLADELPDSGPLAGVLAGLDWAASEGASHIVTVAGDTPFFPYDLVPRLSGAAKESGQPLAVAASNGRAHPVFGLWPVALRDDLRAALADGLRKIDRWTGAHGCATVSFPALSFDPFFNINTPEDLRIAQEQAKSVKIFGVTGWKNNGKTTMVERLVTELNARGYRVSTIKHAHHAFDLDQPGRDSYRHRMAGASEVIVSSERRWALIHENRAEREPDLETLLSKLSPCDLVLIEGYKQGRHPKLEVHRAGLGTPLIADEDTSIRAIASDTPLEAPLPVFGIDEVALIADFILMEVGLGHEQEAHAQ